MPRVFLSYSRDDLAVSAQVSASLSYSPNVSVWFDRDSLYVGDAFKQVIEQEIRNADCFVALLSSHYSPSRFQHYELEQAFAENNRRLSGNSSNPFLLPVYLSPIVVPIDGFDALHRINWQGDGREALMALRSRISRTRCAALTEAFFANPTSRRFVALHAMLIF
jgi:TIR domain